MRIAFDHQIFTQQTYGGISRYFTRIAHEFLGRGENVRLFAPLHINAYVASLPPDTVQGRRLRRYPPKTTRIFFACNQLISRRHIALWKPDLVHETYYARHSSAPLNCPTVVTVHDMIHELFSGHFSSRDKTAVTKAMAIARADHVICVSQNTKRDLISLLGTPEHKISVVLLGFDQLSHHTQSQHMQETKAKPFLLYVGYRGGYKNFVGFLKSVAASQALRADFNVVAFGGGKFTPAELALIVSLGFAPNQVLQVSGDDTLLGGYYAKASAFVYPSLYEGFGIPPLEAMAHSCPVVSSNTSSMPEVIGHAGEYFNPMNTTEMQYAIESVVYSASRQAELKELGNARLANFSWAKCADQTLAVYRTLSW
jgi:glycosyltransferase involved in cell wall biosynthesis